MLLILKNTEHLSWNIMIAAKMQQNNFQLFIYYKITTTAKTKSTQVLLVLVMASFIIDTAKNFSMTDNFKTLHQRNNLKTVKTMRIIGYMVVYVEEIQVLKIWPGNL